MPCLRSAVFGCPLTLARTPLSLAQIGTGGMGLAMASNLQRDLATKALPPLLYTNRTLARGEPLRELGAVPEPSLVELVRRSTLVFSCIANDASVNETLDQVLAALSADDLAGKVWVEMTTIHPDTSCAAADRLAAVGVAFLSAPVFGATVAAVNGQLVLVLSGPQRAKDALAPFADGVLGRKTVDLGADVKAAPLLKLAGNGVLLSVSPATRTLACCCRGDVDR